MSGTTSQPGGLATLAGRTVPRIGYGLGSLARAASTPDGHRNAVAVLHRVVELGITHLDTAQFYGNGLADRLLHEVLDDVRPALTIATKAGARPVTGSPIPMTAAQKPAELRAAVEENLATLGTDHLEIVNLRRMDYRPGLLAEGDQVVPFEDQLAEMIAMRDEGLIAGIGLSHVSAEQLDAALPAGIACVQNLYHLLDRTWEPLLSVCRAHGIAWIPYFPLGGGFGGEARVTDHPVVRRVAEERNITVSQVGLAWQLAHAPVTMLIPGTASIAHLEENTAVSATMLDDDAVAALDAVGTAPASD